MVDAPPEPAYVPVQERVASRLENVAWMARARLEAAAPREPVAALT